uniref:Uncharacterized protein n=1 Tax=Triticum urartu TaxID=4572 RepID=A0A8R7TDA6_TRIUA
TNLLQQYSSHPSPLYSSRSISPSADIASEPTQSSRTCPSGEHLYIIILQWLRAAPTTHQLPVRRPGIHLDCSGGSECRRSFLQVRQQGLRALQLHENQGRVPCRAELSSGGSAVASARKQPGGILSEPQGSCRRADAKCSSHCTSFQGPAMG